MALNRTVLLVEDNENDAELARVAFARCGVAHRLVVAEDGVEALDFVFREGTHAERDRGAPDLVLLDIKLPGIDGFEVLRRMRDDPRAYGVAVVLFTSSVEERDIERSVELGANSYVRKPTDFDESVSIAQLLLRHWLDLHQRPLNEDSP